jgi:hypothetical protein
LEGASAHPGVPKKLADLMGERVEKRLAVLAGQMDRAPRIEIV